MVFNHRQQHGALREGSKNASYLVPWRRGDEEEVGKADGHCRSEA
jgi:hypothetical protein